MLCVISLVISFFRVFVGVQPRDECIFKFKLNLWVIIREC